ncbi:MAG TPA: glycosyltransferase [Solirubrobacteraceae bacterium]|nr:glycosyltransferase [Solirubrobacteraceae bacterium]
MNYLPTATVVIPTRRRASYLDVALNSIVPQASATSAEVLVVSDGPDLPTDAVARRHRVRRIELPPDSGLNAARNAGADAAQSELIVFVDDDVEVLDGWLAALIEAALKNPEYEVYGGPIIPRLEGGPRACGKERPPITALDYGQRDRDVDFVWGANMVVRRSAMTRIGPFDPKLRGRGDEEEWQIRLRESGGRVRYVSAARLLHRRDRQDARLGRMTLAAYRLGRTARRFDRLKGTAPPTRSELRVLAGSIWHTARNRCSYGILFAAHEIGRMQEMLWEHRD